MEKVESTEYEKALTTIRALKAEAMRPARLHWYDLAALDSEARLQERLRQQESAL